MRGRRGLISDQEGALHVIEAVIAAFLMLSALACVQSISGHLPHDSSDDLEQMSTDLLYLLEHGQNRQAHPGLAQALSSQTAWSEQSPVLESELRCRLPAGYRVYMRTPYGDIGDSPPDLVEMSIRPFLACCQETGEMLDCNLILWRP
jgi:hypothetical protein